MFRAPTLPLPPTVSAAADPAALLAELRRRLAGPQRHRLLHGYPTRALLSPAGDRGAGQFDPPWPLDRSRSLIVGVLPHPLCNPTVAGCGFCTFGHEAYRGDLARALALRAADEVRARCEGTPGLGGRRVAALYFGGGTANLTPPDAFAALCAALSASLDLTGAEATLEGTPAMVPARGEALLDLLAALPAATRRLSMGVQTFDPAWLRRMGREAIGGPEAVVRAVEVARRRGLATSCDLLIDLPGQSAAAMVDDVRRAVDLGFDQVCVYHLVLFPGLGTPWSKDAALLAARPDNATSLAAWSTVRAELLARGYVQTTLTNFERRDAHAGERRFRYEALSFTPATTDAAGFGCGAISTFVDRRRGRALKLVNAEESRRYLAATPARPFALRFDHGPFDLRLLHVTRSLSRLGVSAEEYAALTGGDLRADFAPAWSALAAEGLVEVGADGVALTPRGMFFADAAAGLLAWPRVLELRRRGLRRASTSPAGDDDALPQFMG